MTHTLLVNVLNSLDSLIEDPSLSWMDKNALRSVRGTVRFIFTKFSDPVCEAAMLDRRVLQLPVADRN